jgi:hypothetical protein
MNKYIIPVAILAIIAIVIFSTLYAFKLTPWFEVASNCTVMGSLGSCIETDSNVTKCFTLTELPSIYTHERKGICQPFSNEWCWIDYGDMNCSVNTTTTTTVPTTTTTIPHECEDASDCTAKYTNSCCGYKCTNYQCEMLSCMPAPPENCKNETWIGYPDCKWNCENDWLHDWMAWIFAGIISIIVIVCIIVYAKYIKR